MKTVLWIVGVFILILVLDYGYGYLAVSASKNQELTPKGFVVFESQKGLGQFELATQDEKTLVGGEKALFPRISPDGEKIAYSFYSDGKYLLSILSPEGKNNIYNTNSTDPSFTRGGLVWLENQVLAFRDPIKESFVIRDLVKQDTRKSTNSEKEVLADKELKARISDQISLTSKFTATATYVETGFITSIGQDALYIRSKYSIYRKKITTGKPLTNLTWLNDYHFLVQDPDHIYIMRVDGAILKTLDGTNYDYSPQGSPWKETTGIS